MTAVSVINVALFDVSFQFSLLMPNPEDLVKGECRRHTGKVLCAHECAGLCACD